MNPNFSTTTLRCAALGILSVALVAGAAMARDVMNKDGSTSANPRDALRQIVQEQCLTHWREKHDPAPCESLTLADRELGNNGFGLLADRKGGAHYLLIPIKTMAGVDSVELLDPGTPNYFSQAWVARDLLTNFTGHPVPRGAVGLAVNNAHSRGQDQYHIHIECLRQDVVATLAGAADHIGARWTPTSIGGAEYQTMRVMGEDLGAANPYELLVNQMPDTRHRLGDYTFVVAGMSFKEGPGFVLIAGTGPTGELLLDSRCTAAGA